MRQKAQGKARMPTGRGRGGAAQEQHAAGGRGVAAQEHHGAGGFVGKRTEVLRRVRQMAREMVRRRESWVTRWKAIRDFELPYIGVFDGEEDISSRRCGATGTFITGARGRRTKSLRRAS